MFLLAISTRSQLAFVIGCAVWGIALGVAWPLMVLIVGDIFGIAHRGAHCVFCDGCTKAIGTLFLSEHVAGTICEARVDAQEVDRLTRLGAARFRKTHLTGLAGGPRKCVACEKVNFRRGRDLFCPPTAAG